eukprot:Skav200364  [mRNA]  locus=scaffold2518:135461:136009:- [translate_table: standard]
MAQSIPSAELFRFEVVRIGGAGYPVISRMCCKTSQGVSFLLAAPSFVLAFVAWLGTWFSGELNGNAGMITPLVVTAFAFTWFALSVSGLVASGIFEKRILKIWCSTDDQLHLPVAFFSACAAICMICAVAVAVSASIDQTQGGFGFAFYCAVGHIFMSICITTVSVVGWRAGMKVLGEEAES